MQRFKQASPYTYESIPQYVLLSVVSGRQRNSNSKLSLVQNLRECSGERNDRHRPWTSTLNLVTDRAHEFSDESLKSDKAVVLAAVRQYGWALKFSHESLRSDKDVAWRPSCSTTMMRLGTSPPRGF